MPDISTSNNPVDTLSAGAFAFAVPNLLQGIAGNYVTTEYAKDRVDELANKLLKEAPITRRKHKYAALLKRLGIGLDLTKGPPSAVAQQPDLTGLIKKVDVIGAFANGNLSKQRGILAHELGHAIRFKRNYTPFKDILRGEKTLNIMRRASPVVTGIASLYPLITGKESGVIDTGLSLGALAASAPFLREEIAASVLGSKLLKGTGVSRLRAFAGLPTYLTLALAPAIAVGVRRGINRLKDKNRASQW